MLAACRDVFSAGASYFGVADAELLAQHTHKFESRYLDGLIGPYPEAKELYRERSPLYSADKIKVPVALFQVRCLLNYYFISFILFIIYYFIFFNLNIYVI